MPADFVKPRTFKDEFENFKNIIVTENDRPFVKTCSKFDKQDSVTNQICYNEELSCFSNYCSI